MRIEGDDEMKLHDGYSELINTEINVRNCFSEKIAGSVVFGPTNASSFSLKSSYTLVARVLAAE